MKVSIQNESIIKIELNVENKFIFTWSLSNMSRCVSESRRCISSDSLRSPKRVKYTLASVPAFGTSPVNTSTMYLARPKRKTRNYSNLEFNSLDQNFSIYHAWDLCVCQRCDFRRIVRVQFGRRLHVCRTTDRTGTPTSCHRLFVWPRFSDANQEPFLCCHVQFWFRFRDGN